MVNTRIVIAPDSFKGSISAEGACEAIKRGLLTEIPDAEVVCIPMADGGEGTMESIVSAMGGEIFKCEVMDPLGRLITARYGIFNNVAVIEMAEASGLGLITEEERNPLVTTTFGTGQMIKDALARGCREFLICIGGSATNDGGAGMAQALGFRLLDADGEPIPPGGEGLALLDRIERPEPGRFVGVTEAENRDCKFTVACDVTNPLCGPEGASAVFGPQKGADPDMVIELDKNLKHFADIIKRDLGPGEAGIPGPDVVGIPGAGAAGGMGAGSVAFLGAELMRGIELVIEATKLKEKMKGAKYVITGEGRYDSQTAKGKTPLGVALAAKEQGIPSILIAGSISDDADLTPFVHAFAMAQTPDQIEFAVKNAAEILEKTAAEFAKKALNMVSLLH